MKSTWFLVWMTGNGAENGWCVANGGCAVNM